MCRPKHPSGPSPAAGLEVYTYGALLASASATSASELMTEMARRGDWKNDWDLGTSIFPMYQP